MNKRKRNKVESRCGDQWKKKFTFNLHHTQAEEKEEILSKSPYFRVEVSILCGRELIAMDRGGTSDPYVRIMQGEEQLHKSPEKKKTVNPVWNDQANVYIENAFEPLTFQVSCIILSVK